MTRIDQTIATVRDAAKRYGKKPLARAAEIAESNLRYVEKKNWNPRSKTLRSLEVAADAMNQSAEQEAGQRECPQPNSRRGRA